LNEIGIAERKVPMKTTEDFYFKDEIKHLNCENTRQLSGADIIYDSGVAFLHTAIK
jgi:hypothetical protein